MRRDVRVQPSGNAADGGHRRASDKCRTTDAIAVGASFVARRQRGCVDTARRPRARYRAVILDETRPTGWLAAERIAQSDRPVAGARNEEVVVVQGTDTVGVAGHRGPDGLWVGPGHRADRIRPEAMIARRGADGQGRRTCARAAMWTHARDPPDHHRWPGARGTGRAATFGRAISPDDGSRRQNRRLSDATAAHPRHVRGRWSRTSRSRSPGAPGTALRRTRP